MATTEPDNLPHISPLGRVWLAVTRTFFKGLIAILPIAATVYVLVWLAGFLDTPGRAALEGIQLAMGIRKPYNIPGTGLVAGLIVIFCVGVLINAWLIRQLLLASEALLQKLPLAKTVFSSVRDLMGFFSKSGKGPAGQVVAVELGGAKILGFITRQDLSDIPLGPDAGDTVAVYIRSATPSAAARCWSRGRT